MAHVEPADSTAGHHFGYAYDMSAADSCDGGW